MKILLVDDAAIVRMQLKHFIEKELQHEVIAEACNGLEAIKLYGKYEPDVTILDLTMPVMDGFQAFSRIKAEDPNAKIVIYSAIQEESKLNSLKEQGAKFFLEKPLQLSDLSDLKKLRDTLDAAAAS